MGLERLKEILQRIPFTLLLVVYLAYLAYDLHAFNSDEASDLNLKKKEVAAAQEDLAKLNKKVEQTKEFMRSLNTKREELRKLAQELEDTKAVLTETLDVPAFMKLVLTEAQRVGLTVQSIKPGEVSRQEYYAQQLFDVSFRGVYVQLIGFLDRLANLQKIVRVDDFTMKPISSSSARHVELEGMLQLKAFRYAGSKADELGKKETEGTPGAAPSGVPGGEATAAPAKGGT
ncbi:MAG: type 4a pilus biogenesis protein PilO [Oligoflexia bacterium]|nr:type 4a pilus biogenesis protein PilO [Oligoflexia bacterium]